MLLRPVDEGSHPHRLPAAHIYLSLFVSFSDLYTEAFQSADVTGGSSSTAALASLSIDCDDPLVTILFRLDGAPSAFIIMNMT